MTQVVAKPRPDVERDIPENLETVQDLRAEHEQRLARLRLLWDQRRFLYRSAGVGLACAVLLAFLIPSRYESATQLMPPDSQSSSMLGMLAGFTGQGSGMGAIATSLLGLKSTGAIFVGVLKSRSVQDRIIDRFDLKKVYGTHLEQKAREKLTENTEIAEERKSGIIKVTVTDRNPKRAAAIAGGYINELNQLMTELDTSSAHRERVFLEGRLSTVQQDLESAEKDFSQFSSKNATLDINEQAKAMLTAASVLQGQLIAAESELEGLRQIYSDNNVRVRSMQARVSELQHQLEKFGGKVGAPPAAAETGNGAAYPTIRQLPLLGVPYADLFRRLKIQEAVFETLTKEYELAKVEEAKEIPTVKVLDPPEIPERRSFPPRTLIVFWGTLLSIVIGAFWLLGEARWQSIDPEDPGKLFAHEVIQSVKSQMPWASANGSRLSELKEKLRNRFRSGTGPSEEQ